MAIRQNKKSGIYYIYFRGLDGKQHTLSSHSRNRKDAERMDAANKSLIAGERKKQALKKVLKITDSAAVVVEPDKSPVPTHKRGSIRLDAMFDAALQYRKLSRTHKSIFDRFVRECGKTFADQITPQIALDYLRTRYGQGNGKSFNNSKTIINTIFKLCMIETGLEVSPFERIVNMRIDNVQHHRPLTQEEFLMAFNAAEEPWKTASLIAWHTGARLETCKRIMVELLTDPADSITIKPGKTSRFGRSVFIPIHAELRQWIDHIIASGVDWKGWQFKEVKGKERLSYYVSLLRSLGINDTEDGKASFHSLRCSFITNCDREKIDRKNTRGVVGQVSDDTTDLYSFDTEGAKEILNLPSVGIFT